MISSHFILFISKIYSMHSTQHKKVMLVLIGCQTLIWFFILYTHNIFEEWDGVMQFYSGKTLRHTTLYTGWASHFWPPLQPLLISLGNPLSIGKTISFISGCISLVCLYSLASIMRAKSSLTLIMMIYSLHLF